MSLVREIGREENASMFHDIKERLCVEVLIFSEAVESLCVAWLCVFFPGIGAHLLVEWLKAERVRQSLLATMAVSASEWFRWEELALAPRPTRNGAHGTATLSAPHRASSTSYHA